MKDLVTKLEELQKSSDTANEENGLLRAQVGRLNVELKEYRKRLSWMASGSGISAMSAIPSARSKDAYGVNNNDFLFSFPKFSGTALANAIGNNGQALQAAQNKANGASRQTANNKQQRAPGVLSLGTLQNNTDSQNSLLSFGGATITGAKSSNGAQSEGLSNGVHSSTKSTDTKQPQPPKGGAQKNSNSGSPSSSSDSHNSHDPTSCNTSPEPTANSCGGACGYIDGEKTFCEQLGLACGNKNNPVPAIRRAESQTPNEQQTNEPQAHPQLSDIDWFSQQSGAQFDPLLFGDWREPQDSLFSQEFGDFFNDAYTNMAEVDNGSERNGGQTSSKNNDLISQIDKQQEADDEEVVPGEKSQLLSCNKIWYVIFSFLLSCPILSYPVPSHFSMCCIASGHIC